VRNVVYLGDTLPFLRIPPPESVDLIYVDPPFNTGSVRRMQRLRAQRSEQGERAGFGGTRYRTEPVSTISFSDHHDDYLGLLEPRFVEAHRLLKPTDSLYVHLDYREVHYCKVLLDGIFGRECFVNEIIWAYDYGGRSKRCWPTKHDTM